MKWTHTTPVVIAAAALALSVGGQVRAQQPGAPAAGGAQDRVAEVKKTLQQGMALARKYEWVETTTISLKGEEKAKKQNRCYYGADGKVQKISLDQPAQEQGGRAGRGRGARLKEKIVENKKNEMTEYMEKAAALIHQYVPPNPQQIQAAKDAGKISANPQAGGKLTIAIAGFVLPGDALTIDVDPATNRILGLGVSTYLDKKEDAVTLAVQMGSLADGAIYAGQTKLDAKAKNISVVIQNTGHRPVQQ